MSGTKLLAELRRHGVGLPVVFLTGQVIEGDENDRCLLARREALDAYECMAFDQGAVDFIAKSRDRQVLVRRLRRMRSNSPSPRPTLRSRSASTCGKLRLKPQTSRAYWNQRRCRPHARRIQASSICWLSNAGSLRDLSRDLRPPATTKASSPESGRRRLSGERPVGHQAYPQQVPQPATPPSTRSRTTPASGTAGAKPLAQAPRLQGRHWVVRPPGGHDC